MIALSPERAKKYDDYAISEWGIPSAVLMENAGRSTYRLMREAYLRDRCKVVVLAGRGNNGGDGFVIARYALRDGFPVEVCLLGRPEALKGDARLNMELYLSLGGAMAAVEDAAAAEKAIQGSDVIVDAIFGTGLAKEVRGLEAAAIVEINRSGKPVIAVDIPSGLDGAKGVPLGVAVRATHTYTYGHAKLGHLFHPGVSYRGKLTVVDISLPAAAADVLGVDARVVDGRMVRRIFRKRQPDAHKGMFGSVAVIAGSAGKTGAAVMAATAALKIGAGLVTLAVPESLKGIAAAKLTEAMTYPVDDQGKGFFPLSSCEAIREFTADKDVVVMGPGLGRSPETAALVRKLYGAQDKIFVVDADGISSFEGRADLLKEARGRAIFTPHPGEFGRLVRLSPQEVNRDRLDLGRRFATTHGVHLVLKGAPSITFSPEGEAFINPTGNPALSKGGSGDVLTGFIGGLAGQGYTLTEAGFFAAYLHGYIADSWAGEFTDMDLMAQDVISGAGAAIRDIRDGTDRVYLEESL
jgi:NAD(P)H-hydrate epimerase